MRLRCWTGIVIPQKAADLDVGLQPALQALVEPDMCGDPMSPLRWTTKRQVGLAALRLRRRYRTTIANPAAAKANYASPSRLQ
ncbi:hypothetical protein AOB60_01900 [Streptomyces noursei]|uniref:Uncharacterized protein n=1 Tax=Streptomyces noursei TaxID=1971 RepID=A0A2N8PFW6_STRNR|nr:hypothetical protein AOB60_01900 [Streptomyces noursei]